MPVKRLKAFLDARGVKYVTVRHSIAYTAMETADSAHVSGKEFAKTVMVKLDDVMSMAVLRGTDRVDLELLRATACAERASMPTEKEFAGLFPGVDSGAMPPFGNLWEMPVYVDETLTRNASIAFNAGSHSELIRLAWADFELLVKPTVARFALDEPAVA